MASILGQRLVLTAAAAVALGLFAFGSAADITLHQRKQPKFHNIFQANVSMTAHGLDGAGEYPPKEQLISLYFDLPAKRAAITMIKGFETDKTYYRDYSSRQEYMVRSGKYPGCKRSPLLESMPLPTMPDDLKPAGEALVDGRPAWRWHFLDGPSSLYIYSDKSLDIPLAVEEFYMLDGVESPIMTTVWKDIVLFRESGHMPQLALPDVSGCERYMGGFPYIHLFHYFLKV